ncbi:MAG: hypothetical protein GY889_10735 [Proteobacteria bacterium]|nr:hypothetical protein [Pseudomonadota bacterium]
MESVVVLLALALPVTLGSLWLGVLVPEDTPARIPLIWGHGALLGLMLVPQFLWLQNALGLNLSFALPASASTILILTASILLLRRKPVSGPTQPELHALRKTTAAQKWLFMLLLILLIVRLTLLGTEIFLRPLFPWDATMHWATKAKVWFEYRSMVPFTDNLSWLQAFGEGVFTDRHPNYPSTIPLLQVWMNLATGEWNESMMNLPWLVCLAALGGAFYSQLRIAGVEPTLSMVFTYFLLSMPLINTHVALAGYADLFVGAAYCAALMALHNWVSRKQAWQGVLLILFALFLMRLKIEGYMWSLTLAPGLIVALAAKHAVIRLAGIGLLCVIVLALFRQVAPESLHPFLQQFTPFSMKGLMGIIKSVFLHANWHLFAYLLPMVAALSLLLPLSVLKAYRGIATSLIIAVGAFLFLFIFTVFSLGSANFTGVGRLSIQLAPGLMFLCALLSNEILARQVWPTKTPGHR